MKFLKKLATIMILLIIFGVMTPIVNVKAAEENIITYETHVEGIGWQNTFNEGDIAGTTGKKLGIQAIKINSIEGLNINYQAHVEDMGWQSSVKNGEVAGTVGKKKSMEAIKIWLSDENGNECSDYSIYYRVHISGKGWQVWTKDGQVAGTTGNRIKIEAIQICIEKVGTLEYQKMESKIDNKANIDVSYQAHISKQGWSQIVNNGTVVGTTGSDLGIEALKINYNNNVDLKLKYQVHVAKIGWQDTVENGELAGTTGQKKSIEDVKMWLEDENGQISNEYSIFYRVYVSGNGWRTWARDKEECGTTGKGLKVEAIQVKVIKCGTSDYEKYENLRSNVYNTIEYKTHISKEGWNALVGNSVVSGKPSSNANNVEAINLVYSNKSLGLKLKGQAHVESVGWQQVVSGENIKIGTEGQKKNLEAIKLNIVDSNNVVSTEYSIFYQVYRGGNWSKLFKDGESCGTTGKKVPIKAVRIKIAKIGTSECDQLYAECNKADSPIVVEPVVKQPIKTAQEIKREKIIEFAKRYKGTPYQWGATGPYSFDCSGFTQYVYRNVLGIEIGRTTYVQINAGKAVSYAELQPGDLVFPHTGHVGIYIGNGQMIHAPQTGDVVKITSVYKFMTGRRIIY
ncbi:C40 family peptidase [Clostridium sp. MSJ-8]|nr:C40 family peptidase [Clostridium sp. MSJ-8]